MSSRKKSGKTGSKSKVKATVKTGVKAKAQGKTKPKSKSKSKSKVKAKAKKAKKPVPSIPSRPDLMRLRRSRVHGRGAFAVKQIRKGTRIVEYLGDRISHKQADLRYEDKSDRDNHTFLFIVDRGVVIDGGFNGNDARFINHSCDPNCESVIDDRRVFIEAIRAIKPGDELNYDYQIGRDKTDPPDVDEIFACRCGAKNCRGSMLWPPKKKARA
jgi:SET domain-containing protein